MNQSPSAKSEWYCPRCDQWSSKDDWEFEETRDEDGGEHWWICPNCSGQEYTLPTERP